MAAGGVRDFVTRRGTLSLVRTSATIIELDMGKLDEILKRVESKELREEDYATIRTVIESYVGLFYAVGEKTTTIARLRKLFFGAKTEKTAAVFGRVANGSPAQSPARRCPARVLRPHRPRHRRRGHGVPAAALDEADALSPCARGSSGQQPLREGVEKGDPPSA